MHIPVSIIILGLLAWLFVKVWQPRRAEKRRLQGIRRGIQMLRPNLTSDQLDAEVDLYRR